VDLSQKNILITGGQGFLGSQIEYGVKLGRAEMDILDKENVRARFDELKPEIVFHCAVNINMQDCEEHPEKAFQINIEGTRNIAEICKKTGAHLVYFSSNSVFSGNKKTPYFEDDLPDPINVYGKTKYEGEKIVLEMLPEALIVRTSWLFGKGNRSETKFTEICFNKLKSGDEIKAVSDRFGSPTYVPDLLDSVYNLLRENKSGIFHVANSGMATYYDMAKTIKEKAGLPGRVESISADLYPSMVIRKPMEALDSRFIHLRPWSEAMTDYILLFK